MPAMGMHGFTETDHIVAIGWQRRMDYSVNVFNVQIDAFFHL